MANAFKTLSDGDITKELLAEFHNSLTFLKTINNQYDNRFAVEGAKNGGTLLIRDPNEYTVTTGKTLVTQDANESTQTMTVATQKHVGMPSMSSLEKTLTVDDFRERFAKPAMMRLAADVESTILTAVCKDIFNITGVVDTTPKTLLAIRNANARLTQGLAPTGNRSLLLNAEAMANTVDSTNAYFHKQSELENSFIEGYIGRAAGLNWYESEMVPTQTNGTMDATTPVVNTSTGITSGTATITSTGADGNLAVGDVITVADVYAVNRETKVRQSFLQQFVITAAITNDATDVFAVSPTPVTSGAKQNVELVSAGASKAVLHLTGGGSGAASLVWDQNIAYHRDAFTFVTADLHIEPGQRMSREVMEGISMRVWHGCDFANDEFATRVDVLFGYKTIRPEWATRVRNSVA